MVGESNRSSTPAKSAVTEAETREGAGSGRLGGNTRTVLPLTYSML